MKRDNGDIKVVLLAGGLGTRLAEETEVKPKPMVEIGGYPILWHIMKCYSHYGFKRFFVALGYKGDVIKRYFVEYMQMNGSLTVDLGKSKIERHELDHEDWRVHLVETGNDAMTGGRMLRMKEMLKDGAFMMTYGDGLCDVDLSALLKFHRSHGKLATVTVVRPPARFGSFQFDGDKVKKFEEKSQTHEGWINGGFFVLEPGVLDYIKGEDASFERQPMERLARDGQLMAFRHDGFWQCMDTLRDKRLLESEWASGRPPWKAWDK